jgi:sigma-E factor negative regulatory protein RseC
VIETDAIVTRIEGRYMWLDVCGLRCEHCEGAGACGQQGSETNRRQRVRNTIGARVGETVAVAVASGAVLKAAFYSYLLPLTLALISAIAGMALGGESAATVGLFLGLVLGWLGMHWAGRRFSVDGEPALTMRIKPVGQQLHRKQEP